MPNWEEAKEIVESYKKLAWVPKTVQQKSTNISSKFSGIPALLKTESWPCCKNCNEPMQLFLQLNSKNLPKETGLPFGYGLLQVFYCTNQDKECEVKCEAYFPFAKSTLVRVVSLKDDGDRSAEFRNIENSPVKDTFPEKEIIAWNSIDDYPNWEELERFGITLTDEQSELLWELDYPKSKDKLLGWPNWIQGIEYPDCPECGKLMKLIFQIDFEDNLPYMFGDLGCSHITQCEQHRDKMAIAWACG